MKNLSALFACYRLRKVPRLKNFLTKLKTISPHSPRRMGTDCLLNAKRLPAKILQEQNLGGRALNPV